MWRLLKMNNCFCEKKKMVTQSVRLLICLLVVSVAIGCTNDDATSGSGSGSDDQMTIAVIPKSTGGEFWETVEQGARDAGKELGVNVKWDCLLYTSPSPRDRQKSGMPSSA